VTGVLDFGIGNIASILNMIECVHGECMSVHTAEELARCNRLILPGVGAFDEGMSRLNRSGMRSALDNAVAKGTPLLGICLGMQMLGLSSEEGQSEGLGYIPFRLKRFCLKDESLKIPHMGWNSVVMNKPVHPLVAGLPADARFYFVHSYYAVMEDSSDILLTCDYGGDFPAAVCRGSVFGTQFHPEKSHRFGKCLIRNFVHMDTGEEATC